MQIAFLLFAPPETVLFPDTEAPLAVEQFH